ncbi:unnamed protein product [Paramecium primaurelia]|uniref:Uncharacterized protein n=1 Tax=Paramecium primaurelia TaxID=5886 RepID=A0A8S1QQ30_PARPR|nr:unnamed protein product [Paramecium primaurelia]
MYQQSLVSTIKPLTQTNLNIQSQYKFIEPIQDPVLQVVVERNTIHNQFQLDLELRLCYLKLLKIINLVCQIERCNDVFVNRKCFAINSIYFFIIFLLQCSFNIDCRRDYISHEVGTRVVIAKMAEHHMPSCQTLTKHTDCVSIDSKSLSYIRFMECQFPPNLSAFLNIYTKVSLQPMLRYFQVEQLLIKLNRGINKV